MGAIVGSGVPDTGSSHPTKLTSYISQLWIQNVSPVFTVRSKQNCIVVFCIMQYTMSLPHFTFIILTPDANPPLALDVIFTKVTQPYNDSRTATYVSSPAVPISQSRKAPLSTLVAPLHSVAATAYPVPRSVSLSLSVARFTQQRVNVHPMISVS